MTRRARLRTIFVLAAIAGASLVVWAFFFRLNETERRLVGTWKATGADDFPFGLEPASWRFNADRTFALVSKFSDEAKPIVRWSASGSQLHIRGDLKLVT